MISGRHRREASGGRTAAAARLAVLAAAGAALLAGCGNDRFPDYRYKMTIVVSTPEGEKSFSSVREVEQKEAPSIQDSSGRKVETRLRGEAVILDLPGGQTAYALLSRQDSPEYAEHVAGAALMPAVRKPVRDERFDDLKSKPTEYLDRQAADEQAMVKIAGPRDLPRERTVNSLGVPLSQPVPLWPMFVTFDDPRDPRTIREVSPEALGVRRIQIELTDEPVSEGIEKRLPWLPNYYSRQFSGDRFQSLENKSKGLSAFMTSGAFSVGNGLNGRKDGR